MCLMGYIHWFQDKEMLQIFAVCLQVSILISQIFHIFHTFTYGTRSQGLMAHLIYLSISYESFAKCDLSESAPERICSQIRSRENPLPKSCGSILSLWLALTDHMTNGNRFSQEWIWERILLGADSGADSLSTLWLAQTDHMTPESAP